MYEGKSHPPSACLSAHFISKTTKWISEIWNYVTTLKVDMQIHTSLFYKKLKSHFNDFLRNSLSYKKLVQDIKYRSHIFKYSVYLTKYNDK
jgi:hypothetical protein